MKTNLKIPQLKGIQTVERTLKDGSKVLYFRVQINRKNYKADEFFTDENPIKAFEEAKEFLLSSKSKTGVNQIKLLQHHKEIETKVINDYLSYETLNDYIRHYLKIYIEPKYEQFDKTTALGKHKLRGYTNTVSFYNILAKTEITVQPKDVDDPLKFLNPKLFKNPKVKLGELKPSDLTDTEINEYIKERLAKGIRPISIERELTQLSVLYKKLRHIDIRLKGVPNPALEYDKDLLTVHAKNFPKKKKKRLTADLEQKYFDVLDNYSNPEMAQIIRLQLYCSLRISEAVLLKWSDIKHNHIVLEHTKSREEDGERVVFLSQQARDFIDTIPRGQNKKEKDRLFSYGSVAGFLGSYEKLIEANDLPVNTHMIRKTGISRHIEKIGSNNSLMLAEFLGITNIKKFEQTHIKQAKQEEMTEMKVDTDLTQAQAIKSFGHKSSDTTSAHYFSLERVVEDPNKPKPIESIIKRKYKKRA